MKNEKFVLLEKYSMEVLREYENIDEMKEDLQWKAPESLWIGIVGEKQAYTIPQIKEKYNLNI